MKTIQLSDTIFVNIADGDLFIYKYSDNYFAIKEVINDEVPPINEFTVEILSLYSQRHFRFKREGQWYWWYEVKF